MLSRGVALTSAEDAALAAIVRSSQDAVIAKTPDGVVTAWNDGATALYGYPPEEMLGRNIDVTFPPEAAEKERARHARVAAGHGESGYRCERLRANGSKVVVVMSMLPVRAEDGRITGLATISRGTSDEERANERFAAVLGAAPDAMICVDSTGRISVVNAQATAVFGYPRDELLGTPIEVLVPEALREVHLAHRDEYLLDPQARSMGSGLSLNGRRRDGSTFPVEVSLSFSGRDEDRLVIAVARDVTVQQATESSLRESEIRLRQLAENVDTVFTLIQHDPRAYLYISPGFENLTGYTVEEAMTNPTLVYDKVIHPDDLPKLPQIAVPGAANPPDASDQVRIVRKNGEIRWVRFTANAVANPNGPPERTVAMTEDITDRVLADQRLAEAEAEARAANEAKNEFLSRMSHELRTPLNAVLGFGQLLELDLDGTEHADSVHHVLRAGRHLLGLINDVLDISRIEAGEMSISLEPVNVSDLVEEVRRLMEPIAAERHVSLQLDPSSVIPPVLADAQRLRQILLNLAGNAVKYNRVGGHVWLGWRSQEGRISIDVGDNGPGIAEHLQHRLFVPFDRLGAEATAVEGTGVGLALTRGLAELMAGEVTYRSQPGTGSVFTVTLPAADPTPEPVTRPALRNALHRGSNPNHGQATVLYIEDNVVNVQLLESVLALRPEWTMLHAALGRLGLELARAHVPDLVLLDLHLPDSPGLEVLRSLRAEPTTAGIPIVVLSADASPSQVRALTEAGAQTYLTKPLELNQVLDLLDATTASPTRGTS
jgi:PAS domain S-box-containing protein